MNFDNLDAIARKLMLNRRSHNARETGHGYYHCNRVMRGVIELRCAQTDDASHDELLRAAALLHDCGKAIEPHNVSSAALVGEFLKGECTPDELKEIQRLIYLHDLRGTQVDLWAALMQDADLLDHYGCMEIWRKFLYAGYHDKPASESMNFRLDKYPAQVDSDRALLNLEVSRRVLDEKVQFTYEFISRMKVELTGGYVLDMSQTR